MRKKCAQTEHEWRYNYVRTHAQFQSTWGYKVATCSADCEQSAVFTQDHTQHTTTFYTGISRLLLPVASYLFPTIHRPYYYNYYINKIIKE